LQESEIAGRGEPYRLLTQDVSFYLVAISQNTVNDSLTIYHSLPRYDKQQEQGTQSHNQKHDLQEQSQRIHPDLYDRANLTLDTIRKRVWKEKWPLVTESELKETGPWPLKPYQYHNHTFWPWTTGIEMLARSRFNRIEECDILLSKLASEGHPHLHAFYEWINPITDQGNGAYPFRTGISAIRIAITDIVGKIGK
jgi:hypothetical protein